MDLNGNEKSVERQNKIDTLMKMRSILNDNRGFFKTDVTEVKSTIDSLKDKVEKRK